jgi:hypothetical protein
MDARSLRNSVGAVTLFAAAYLALAMMLVL